MSDLAKFAVNQQTKKSKKALTNSLMDMLHLGIQEFAKSITGTVDVPQNGKNQIPQELSRIEKKLQRQRSPRK